MSTRSFRTVVAVLTVVLLLAIPTAGALSTRPAPSASSAPPAPPRAPAPGRGLAATWTESRVFYDSSADGFNLSYEEVLPAGYSSSVTYPLAVELHGIALNEDAVKVGGYVTGLPTTTYDASSAAGFILIVPNTRMGDGYYTDSPYTGPQAQDVLDAIAKEKTLRSVSSVYLYGFSMGGMGALAIGLAHPSEFAGLGGIATESDMYEMSQYDIAIHSSGVLDALLNVSGGYPQNSSTARGVYDFLSALREHPTATHGLKMYFTAGGRDVAIPNDPSVWGYQQANDSILETSCLNASTFSEPAGCTTPLSVYAALDPANYTFRYVYEDAATHSYSQLNATDLYAYFSGLVPSGLYQAAFPTPIPLPLAVPLVTLVTEPFNCGTISLNGTVYSSGQTVALPRGVYNVLAQPCPGASLTALDAVGGVRFLVGGTLVSVVLSGAIVAHFAVAAAATASVQFLATSPCTFGTINGTVVTTGSTLTLPLSVYAIRAASCGSEAFDHWLTTGAVGVGDAFASSTSLSVTGNGTVEAVFVPPGSGSTVTVNVVPSSCGPVSVAGALTPNGDVLVFANGSYAITAPDCFGYAFAGWTETGNLGVTVPSSAATTLLVTGSGSLTATYVAQPPPPPPSMFRVSFFVSPASCGPAIRVDNVSYPDASSGWLSVGSHPLSVGPCVNETFASWSSSGGVVVGVDTLAVGSNGTVTATYVYHPPGQGGGVAANSTAPTFPDWGWAVGGAAAGGAVVALGALLSRRRSVPPSPT